MKPLAANNIINTLLFPIIMLIIVVSVGVSGLLINVIALPIVIFVFAVLLAWVVFGVRDTYNIFYDSEFIYLKGLLNSHKLSLSTIISVTVDKQGMRVVGVTSWKYRIAFDESVKVKPQFVHQTAGHTNVQDFIAVAKLLNPDLDFEA